MIGNRRRERYADDAIETDGSDNECANSNSNFDSIGIRGICDVDSEGGCQSTSSRTWSFFSNYALEESVGLNSETKNGRRRPSG